MLGLGLACGVLTGGGAALFRLRGDDAFKRWTGRGATTARLLWASYLATCAWAVDNGTQAAWSAGFYLTWLPGRSYDWSWTEPLPLVWLLLALSLWLGSIAGWWQSLDLGTHEGTLARDLPMHSLRGLLFTAPPALVLWWFGLGTPWPLLIAGALCGPIYYAALLVSRRRWYWQAGPLGEWGFGAAEAAALIFAVGFS